MQTPHAGSLSEPKRSNLRQCGSSSSGVSHFCIRTASNRSPHRSKPRWATCPFRSSPMRSFSMSGWSSDCLPLGLNHAQITLDGDASTHSLTRVCRSGEDTFETVFRNIVDASRHIRITVNGNYSRDTVHGFEPLIAQLAEAGDATGDEDHLLTRAQRTRGMSITPVRERCSWSGSDTSQHVRLHDATLRAGFDAPELAAVGPCELHERHSYAIDVDGALLSCPAFFGHGKTWGIGHGRHRAEPTLRRAARSQGAGCMRRMRQRTELRRRAASPPSGSPRGGRRE